MSMSLFCFRAGKFPSPCMLKVNTARSSWKMKALPSPCTVHNAKHRLALKELPCTSRSCGSLRCLCLLRCRYHALDIAMKFIKIVINGLKRSAGYV